MALQLVLITTPPFKVEAAFTKHQLETVFIYQFTNYIEWPDSKHSSTAPFTIDVFGDTPMVEELQKLARTKTIGQRKIVVREVDDWQNIGPCQILVIATEDTDELEKILSKVRGLGVLTISQAPGFGESGVMINFFLESGKLRFEINRSALKKGKFSVSAQLLKLAKLIN